MTVFERHVFVCTSGEWCPAVDGDGIGVHAAMKESVKAAGLAGHVRVNRAGCFSQCGNGPMAVVYPDDVWYAALTPEDVDEVVAEHLVAGRPVERLRYRPPTMGAHKLEREPDGRPVGRTARWPARSDAP